LLAGQFARREENRLLEVTLRSGRKEALYRSDVISGAIIASVVERAKGMAIKRSIANAGVTKKTDDVREEGISEADLQVAFNAEYLENEILPATDITEDWLKLIDYDPDNVVKISPVRMLERSKAKPTSGVI
jgi:proteasome-associated ATPase